MKRLAAWWLRVTHRHYCFLCERPTVFDHLRHQDEVDRLLFEEWRS